MPPPFRISLLAIDDTRGFMNILMSPNRDIPDGGTGWRGRCPDKGTLREGALLPATAAGRSGDHTPADGLTFSDWPSFSRLRVLPERQDRRGCWKQRLLKAAITPQARRMRPNNAKLLEPHPSSSPSTTRTSLQSLRQSD